MNKKDNKTVDLNKVRKDVEAGINTAFNAIDAYGHILKYSGEEMPESAKDIYNILRGTRDIYLPVLGDDLPVKPADEDEAKPVVKLVEDSRVRMVSQLENTLKTLNSNCDDFNDDELFKLQEVLNQTIKKFKGGN